MKSISVPPKKKENCISQKREFDKMLGFKKKGFFYPRRSYKILKYLKAEYKTLLKYTLWVNVEKSVLFFFWEVGKMRCKNFCIHLKRRTMIYPN